jgi:hypothetical protein
MAAVIPALGALLAIGLTALAGIGLAGHAGAAPGPADDGGRSATIQAQQPPDYGDLIFLYRDANGVPILDVDQCQQPIAFPSDTCLLDCTGLDPCLVPVDPATCAVEVAYATCTKEVEFGRLNEARSPPRVFERQLEDVVVNLSTADCVTLDPAGRLVTSRVGDTPDDVSTSAIDSPLQNLAIYRQLTLVGYLGEPADPIVLPGWFADTAARALGAASDKTGEVNVDLVAYLNQIMSLSDPATPTVVPKICIDVKEEVEGVVKMVQKCFLRYAGYQYERAANFMTLPDPPYIPDFAPMPGWFEYLAEVDPPVDPPMFEIVQGPILDAVFGADPGFLDGNIGGFAQAADDTRAVILFMHSWQVPLEYATPVPCVDSGETTYDVSISEMSGLQVPVRIVDGSEGREFTVTVDNESASPDAASGTVTVTAVESNGDAIDTFPRVFTFTDLAPGTSMSWTEFFSINLGYQTTITWTATAEAEFDVNLANNTVTETSEVIRNIMPGRAATSAKYGLGRAAE